MLEKFLSQYKSTETRKVYKSRISNFLEYLEKTRTKIDQIDEGIVKAFIRRFKTTTRNNYLTAIKVYHAYVTGKELDIESKKVDTYRHDRNISKQDVQELICKANKIRDKLIIKTLFETGIRVNELAKLTKQNISKQRGVYYLNFIAKGKKKRQIKLSNKLADLLLSFESGKSTIFGITNRQIERIFNQLGLEILGRIVTPHMMRHGFATELMKQGVSFSKIQEALGHENIVTTLKYLHNKRDKEKWVLDLDL